MARDQHGWQYQRGKEVEKWMVAYSCGPFGRSGRIVSVHVTGYISHRSCARGQGVLAEKGVANKTSAVRENKHKKGKRAGGKEGGEKRGRTYCGVRLDRAIERHQRAPLLCDLRVLAMESALLVLLHACNLFLQSAHECEYFSGKKGGGKKKRRRGGRGGRDSPFLRPCVTVDVARRRQRVSACRLVLDDLSSSYVRPDDSRVSYDFRGPFTVDVTLDAQHPPPAVRSDAHIPVAFHR